MDTAPDATLPTVTTDSPAMGSEVTLLPVDGGNGVTGEVTLWSTSPGGTVVTSRVRTGLAAAAALRGRRVWVSARGHDLSLIHI